MNARRSAPTVLPALRVVRDGEVRERSGEPTIEELYVDYASYVGAIASRILGRAAEVDDVVQEVFTAAVRDLARREHINQVRAWLVKVTVRRCMRHLRLRRLWVMFDSSAAYAYEDVAQPGAGTEKRMLVATVYRALDRIPANERVPWTLRHVEGESLDQVAVLCDVSLATVKRRIGAAHQKILMYMAEARA
jgi:RNA polymerase sigma-70 factor (ECF subfamily)